MNLVCTLGINLAKNTFLLHGVYSKGEVVLLADSAKSGKSTPGNTFRIAVVRMKFDEPRSK